MKRSIVRAGLACLAFALAVLVGGTAPGSSQTPSPLPTAPTQDSFMRVFIMPTNVHLYRVDKIVRGPESTQMLLQGQQSNVRITIPAARLFARSTAIQTAQTVQKFPSGNRLVSVTRAGNRVTLAYQTNDHLYHTVSVVIDTTRPITVTTVFPPR